MKPRTRVCALSLHFFSEEVGDAVPCFPRSTTPGIRCFAMARVISGGEPRNIFRSSVIRWRSRDVTSAGASAITMNIGSTRWRHSVPYVTQGRRKLPPLATDCARHLAQIRDLAACDERHCSESVCCTGIRIQVSCFRAPGVPVDGWSCYAELFPSAAEAGRAGTVHVHHSRNRSPDRGFSRARGGVGWEQAPIAFGVIDNSSFMHHRVVSTSPTEAESTWDQRLHYSPQPITTPTATMKLRVLIYCFRCRFLCRPLIFVCLSVCLSVCNVHHLGILQCTSMHCSHPSLLWNVVFLQGRPKKRTVFKSLPISYMNSHTERRSILSSV